MKVYEENQMKKFKKMMYLKLARAFGRSNNCRQVPTIIGETTKVCGDINSNGILHVDGYIEGDINCEELVIGVKGNILGTVKAQSMFLYGTLQGKATADSLFIANTAKLIGDATHNTIAIEPGAYIDGHCIRVQNKPAAEPAASEAPKTAAAPQPAVVAAPNLRSTVMEFSLEYTVRAGCPEPARRF